MLLMPRRLLVLLPIPVVYFMSDRTMANFLAMLIGGLVFWIPYWLAWWISDGFELTDTGYIDQQEQEKWRTVPH